MFDVPDGVQSEEFSQGVCCETPDGWMAFGGINGFNWFHPDSVVVNSVPPPVVLTRFLVFDRELRIPQAVSPATRIVLERGQNFFSFEFAALDYAAATNSQYAYRLEGFDEQWIQNGHRRLARYTNVGPGTYTFHVKASNNDGFWNEEGVAVTITILPGYWETWWFRFLAALGVASLFVGIYRYRVNRLLAVQRTRERIARDLHDDVSAILSGISYFSSAVKGDQGNMLTGRSAHFVSLITKSSAEVLELLHDIIWSIHPDGDRVENIAAKCRRFASDLCESRSIRHAITIADVFPSHPVDPEKRKNLWLLYKELVVNAVRHAECTELRVTLEVSNAGMVHLLVADNGKGFDPQSLARENGLRNIRQRARALAGELTLRTAPGNGTQWSLTCPLWK